MITEKETIKCEVVFNEERTHRFSWKRVWNKDKPMVAVVMLNPCSADCVVTDTTTSLVVNNVAALEKFGGVEIVNLYSMLTSKLNFRWNSDEDLNHPENDNYIITAAKESEAVIVAWGRAVDENKRIIGRVEQVMKLLEPFSEKLICISHGENSGFHPLTPCVRSGWTLVKFEYKKPDENIDSEAQTDNNIEVKVEVKDVVSE